MGVLNIVFIHLAETVTIVSSPFPQGGLHKLEFSEREVKAKARRCGRCRVAWKTGKSREANPEPEKVISGVKQWCGRQ